MISEVLELRQLMNTRKVSPVELEAVRNRKLRATIRHAYEYVPYYRSLFQAAGLLPEAIQNMSDLQRIPMTTKDHLRKAGVECITAKGVDLNTCQIVRTSGTSGKPFKIHLSCRDLRTRRLGEFRTLLSIGFRPRDRLAVLGPAHPHVMRFHEHLGFYRSVNISPTLPWHDQIDILNRSRPSILWVYPTVFKSLLDRVNYRLDALANPRLFITSSEVCDNMLKGSIQQNSKRKMLNFYGANEVGRIAAECPAQEGLHVNEDHVILEIVPSEHHIHPEGYGEAVVTTLNGLAQPFVRYYLGDVCRFTEKPCSCGSPFPLIIPPIGRSSEVVKLPSGKCLSLWPFTFLLRNISGLQQHRIIQERPELLIVQLAFKEHPDHNALGQLRSRFVEFLGEAVKVDIHCVDAISDETLKFRSFISHVH